MSIILCLLRSPLSSQATGLPSQRLSVLAGCWNQCGRPSSLARRPGYSSFWARDWSILSSPKRTQGLSREQQLGWLILMHWVVVAEKAFLISMTRTKCLLPVGWQLQDRAFSVLTLSSVRLQQSIENGYECYGELDSSIPNRRVVTVEPSSRQSSATDRQLRDASWSADSDEHLFHEKASKRVFPAHRLWLLVRVLFTHTNFNESLWLWYSSNHIGGKSGSSIQPSRPCFRKWLR